MAKEILIGTREGKTDLCNLQPKDISLESICGTLGNICRFNGRVNRHFSIAQHSMLVACILDDMTDDMNVIIGGACHDFAEAFIGDIATPLKNEIALLEELEPQILKSIAEQIDIGNYDSDLVHKADQIACYQEACELGLDTSWWGFPESVTDYELSEEAFMILCSRTQPEQSATFLEMLYNELTKEKNNAQS